jgi:hypothetical protein
MLFYGLHDRQLASVVEWYTSREAADAERATILCDEPQWASTLEIVLVEFTGAGVQVEGV